MSIADLLSTEPTVVTVGTPLLADALAAQGVAYEPVEWAPPPPGAEADLAALAAVPGRAAADRTAFERMAAVHPHLVGVTVASEAVGIGRHQLLHAGPPLTWDRASGPMRGGIIAALLYEGWADTPEEAEHVAATSLELSPCHHHHAVGPMAGIVSPSMPMWVLEDRDGRKAHCTLNEGLGKVLRYGAYEPSVIERLRWMEAELAPALTAALAQSGPIDVRAIIANMLAMGDEGHNRNRAATSMLFRALAPAMVRSGLPSDQVADALTFIDSNDHFFLNVGMPAGKLIGDAAEGIEGSGVVTAMARNGTDFGIRVSGTGDRWFTAPANVPDGLLLAGFTPEDANPDIGDSAITETVGLGGFAMATAPAIVQLVGGDTAYAMAATRLMYEITVGEHPTYTVPALGFRGLPTGIDVTRVVRTGEPPIINTGMAGKVAGTGQVGAGLVRPPMEIFVEATAALAALTTGTPS
ncbi:MAG: DUF1116 domain-containing protein [Actinomycetota bacterium]|nr:DUF1116 domain-containing protein [Actinomycetota bacterium]